MEAAMPRVMRADKNSELLDKFGMASEPTTVMAVLDCHAAPAEKKRNVFVPQL